MIFSARPTEQLQPEGTSIPLEKVGHGTDSQARSNFAPFAVRSGCQNHRTNANLWGSGMNMNGIKMFLHPNFTCQQKFKIAKDHYPNLSVQALILGLNPGKPEICSRAPSKQQILPMDFRCGRFPGGKLQNHLKQTQETAAVWRLAGRVGRTWSYSAVAAVVRGTHFRPDLPFESLELKRNPKPKMLSSEIPEPNRHQL